MNLTEPTFSRVWAMPNAETFSVKPIGEMVQRYLRESKCSVDVFARNRRWATWTNDLNPNTAAEYHMDALDFLKMLQERGVRPDLVIFDPPYSPRQVKECYDGIGRHVTAQDTQRVGRWKEEKELIFNLLVEGGKALSFGWNSSGMGKRYRFDEIMLVSHGSAHNDTICVAQTKPAINHHETEPTLDTSF